MKEHNGNSTKNARIRVDYQGNTPKVKFSYPDFKNQDSGGMFGYLLIFWFPFAIVGFYGFMGGQIMSDIYEPSQLEEFTQCAIKYPYSVENNYSHVSEELCNDIITSKGLFNILKEVGLMFVWILGVPCLIYFPFKKKWNKLYPKFQGFFSRKKYMKFKPEDVVEFKNDFYVEVPTFDNVILNYEATEDFSKYLKYFEIREHPFKYFRKKKGKIVKSVNESLWYARFYFNKKPTKGKLEVLFK